MQRGRRRWIRRADSVRVLCGSGGLLVGETERFLNGCWVAACSALLVDSVAPEMGEQTGLTGTRLLTSWVASVHLRNDKGGQLCPQRELGDLSDRVVPARRGCYAALVSRVSSAVSRMWSPRASATSHSRVRLAVA